MSRTASFHRLTSLENCAEVRRRLCAGVSCESVAEWLQDDLGLATDVSRAGLIRQLYRYRDTIPLSDRAPKQISRLRARIEQFTHRVNTLAECVKLYELQLTRICKLVDVEDLAEETIRALGPELDRAMKYLRQISELKGEMGREEPTGNDDMPYAATSRERMAGVIQVLEDKYGSDVEARLAWIGKRLNEALQPIIVAPGRALPPSDVEYSTESNE